MLEFYPTFDCPRSDSNIEDGGGVACINAQELILLPQENKLMLYTY